MQERLEMQKFVLMQTQRAILQVEKHNEIFDKLIGQLQAVHLESEQENQEYDELLSRTFLELERMENGEKSEETLCRNMK